MMVTNDWDSDFRNQAIHASIAKLKNNMTSDPFEVRCSFCLPIQQRPLPALTPGKIFLAAVILGFVGLASALGFVTWAQNVTSPWDTIYTLLGLAFTISGFALFLVPLKFDRYIYAVGLGERYHELKQRGGKELMSAELCNASTASRINIDSDDYVLFYSDVEHRRLIIEGIAATYQICKEDVTFLMPYEFMNYRGVSLGFYIDSDTVLNLAIARTSTEAELRRQLPFLSFILRRPVKNRIFEVATQALGPVRREAHDVSLEEGR